MNITEAKGLLFDYFTKNDSFNLDENFSDVVKITENEALDRAALQVALTEYIKNEIVVEVMTEKGYNWILNKSLEAFPQNVQLGRATIGAMQEILSGVAEQLKSKEYLLDPLNVTEKDVQNIILLLQKLLVSQKS